MCGKRSRLPPGRSLPVRAGPCLRTWDIPVGAGPDDSRLPGSCRAVSPHEHPGCRRAVPIALLPVHAGQPDLSQLPVHAGPFEL